MRDKQEIRREALARRREMDGDAVARASELICAKVIALKEFVEARVIYAYAAYRNEVDTRAIIAASRAAGKPVAYPVVISDAVSFRVVNSVDDLELGPFGILSPRLDAPILQAMRATDVCVVPGVCFREDGHRLGRGKGHYDRFLAQFPGVTVGIAYDWQITNDFAAEAHDVAMQIILTERRELRAPRQA